MSTELASESLHIGFYHPRAGITTGGGKSVYVRGMIRQLADDHEVTLYTGKGDLLEEVRRLPITVTQIPDYGADRFISSGIFERLPISSTMRTSISRYVNACRLGICRQMSRQLDLLYTQYYLDDLLFSRTVEVPTVYHCHGLDGRGIGEQVRKRLSTSEICLANTEFIAGELSHSFGIDHDGIVSPGIDLDTFTPDAEPAFRTDEAAVLFVGRLASTNGVHDLVEAYARLESEAELYIAGHGARERPLRDQVSEYGLEDSVHFLGAVPNEELPGYYVSADVVCNPTHYESLGLVNLEALACGRPLVTSRIDAITSYVTHGESGILVPPGDVDALAASLDRLLESPELRQRLSSGARDVARAYSWDRQATHLVEIFSSELSDEDSSV